MKKRILLTTLLFFPIFLHAQDFFVTASASVGVLFGPDFINTDEDARSFGGELYIGGLLFGGIDYSQNEIVFNDTKTVSGATGNFSVLDGVVGLSVDLGLSRALIGTGAGLYFGDYTGNSNTQKYKGFAMSFFWAAYFKPYGLINFGINSKLYALSGIGWYNTIGVFACFNIN